MTQLNPDTRHKFTYLDSKVQQTVWTDLPLAEYICNVLYKLDPSGDFLNKRHTFGRKSRNQLIQKKQQNPGKNSHKEE